MFYKPEMELPFYTYWYFLFLLTKNSKILSDVPRDVLLSPLKTSLPTNKRGE